MQSMDATDEHLWEVCKKLPSDWEPHGQRRWHGQREARPDCDACRWFVDLFRTSPDWGVCANPESARAGLLTFREQGCWKHEPEEEGCHEAARPSRCEFMRAFERFLREEAADFIREEVRRANDPSPDEEPPDATPEDACPAPLSVLVHRLLRHADEDFRRPAFEGMAARARKDAGRCWESARRCLARTVGRDIPEIRLPENMRELEEKFWGRVDAAIAEALEGPGPGPAIKRHRRVS